MNTIIYIFSEKILSKMLASFQELDISHWAIGLLIEKKLQIMVVTYISSPKSMLFKMDAFELQNLNYWSCWLLIIFCWLIKMTSSTLFSSMYFEQPLEKMWCYLMHKKRFTPIDSKPNAHMQFLLFQKIVFVHDF